MKKVQNRCWDNDYTYSVFVQRLTLSLSAGYLHSSSTTPSPTVCKQYDKNDFARILEFMKVHFSFIDPLQVIQRLDFELLSR